MPAKNILIADDDQVILDLLEEILQMEGYETFLVSNGEEAVETTKKYPIDVAILDKKMPIMDGIEALKRIKKIDSTVEVLIMTGYADIETLRQSLTDYGAFDYLLKPLKIKREEICNAVRNALLKRDHALKDDFIEKELNNRILQLEKDFEEKTRELRESQIKYKEIVENSTEGILIAQDEKLKFVNPKVLELTGFTEEEILNIPFIELVYPEDRTMVMDRFTRRLQEDETSNSHIFRVLRKGGDSFWAEINSVRTIWEERPAVMANIKDINDSVESEEKLRDSEERFKEMATLLPTIIGEFDVNFYLTYANEAAFETFGYSQVDLEADLNVINVIHPADKDKALENMKKVLEGMKLDGNEYRMLRKDGSELTMLVHSHPIYKYGRVVGIRSTLTDITRRKQAEEDLRESEGKYRSLFENANDAIFIADTKTNRILDANKQAEQLIGRPRKEIIGMHQSRLHHPSQVEYYQDKFRDHVNKGKIFDLEAEVIKKNGSIVPVFISASVISLHGREVMQGLFKDITEEREILELKEEIATRKLIEKAKGILMDRHNISEQEAKRRLQKESRSQRKKIKEIAQGVISSKSILK